MRVYFQLDLGEVEITSDSGHGEIIELWVGNNDMVEATAVDFVKALAGRDYEKALQAAIEDEQEMRLERRRQGRGGIYD